MQLLLTSEIIAREGLRHGSPTLVPGDSSDCGTEVDTNVRLGLLDVSLSRRIAAGNAGHLSRGLFRCWI